MAYYINYSVKVTISKFKQICFHKIIFIALSCNLNVQGRKEGWHRSWWLDSSYSE